MLTAPTANAAQHPNPDSASAQVAAQIDDRALSSAVDAYSVGDPDSAAELASTVAPNAARDIDQAAGVDLGSDGSLVLTSDDTEGLEIGITAQGTTAAPEMIDGMAVSSEAKTDLDIVTRATPEGAQLLAVLGTAKASNRVAYDLDLPEGAELIELPDGSILISTTFEAATETPEDSGEAPGSQSVAEISAPWAVDANGEPVETHFELDGTTLTQVVETNQDTAFPVVADPSAWWWTKHTTICVAQLATAALPIKLAAVSAKITKMAKTNPKIKKVKKYIDQLGGLKKTLGYLRTYITKKGKSLSVKNKERVENLLKLGGNTLAEMLGIGTCWRIVDEIRK